MNQVHADSPQEANPFAFLMDPASCLEAHGRLSRLPQKQYRHMDQPNHPRGGGAPAASTKDDDRGIMAECIRRRSAGAFPRSIRSTARSQLTGTGSKPARSATETTVALKRCARPKITLSGRYPASPGDRSEPFAKAPERVERTCISHSIREDGDSRGA